MKKYSDEELMLYVGYAEQRSQWREELESEFRTRMQNLNATMTREQLDKVNDIQVDVMFSSKSPHKFFLTTAMILGILASTLGIMNLMFDISFSIEILKGILYAAAVNVVVGSYVGYKWQEFGHQLVEQKRQWCRNKGLEE